MVVPRHPFNVFEISPKVLLIQVITLSTENLVSPEQEENSGWSVVAHGVNCSGKTCVPYSNWLYLVMVSLMLPHHQISF